MADGATGAPAPVAVNDAAGGSARPAEVALLASVFIVAACGLVYELAAGRFVCPDS